MLISYELSWECVEHEYRPFWTETLLQSDAQQARVWEHLSSTRLSAEDLATLANEGWNLPEVDGEEILRNFDEIPLYRSSAVSELLGWPELSEAPDHAS